eukprot:2250323-Pleurochrysis_carterae.AAC.1
MRSGGGNRRASAFIEAVTKDSFTSHPAMLTSVSKALVEQKPVLMRDCMACLRDNVESIDENEDKDEEGDGEHTAWRVDSSKEDAPAGRAG